jgi:hypothetical protein
MPSLFRRWFRPRGLILTLMLVLVASLIWRNQRMQREADSAAVADWVRDAAMAALANRDAPVSLGATEPVVASAFLSWVRTNVPKDRATEVRVSVETIGRGPFGAGDGVATHRADVQLPGARAEADVHWPQDGRAMVAWRADPPPR